MKGLVFQLLAGLNHIDRIQREGRPALSGLQHELELAHRNVANACLGRLRLTREETRHDERDQRQCGSHSLLLLTAVAKKLAC